MKKLILILLVLVSALPKLATAQKEVVLETYNNQKETVASGSITLKPGFVVQAGANFNAYISNPAGAVQNNYYVRRDHNYVITHLVKQAGITNPSDSTNLNVHVNTTIEYVDGMGRTAGTVAVKASPSLNSILQYRTYDDMGIERTKYLPYAEAGQLGQVLPTAFGTTGFYASAPNVAHTAYPLSETKFENSPLNRVLEQGAPGDAWQLSTSTSPNKGHVIKWTYDSQHAPEALYKVLINNTTGVRTLSRAGNNAVYPQNAIERTVVMDENNTTGTLHGSVLECKDRDGRLIVKRQYNKKGTLTEVLSTYYVYDDFGNLCFVLPPAAKPDTTLAITQVTLDNFCYQYKYDDRQRMIGKKIPGKGWENFIYNAMDQLVYHQDSTQFTYSDPNLPSSNPYHSFTKYDALGRVILSGIERNRVWNQKQIQDAMAIYPYQWEKRSDSTGNMHGYSKLSMPYNDADMQVQVVNYYDDYSIPGLPNDQSAAYTKMTRGLLTATKTLVLGTASTYLWTINYYDDEGRVVKVWKQHYKGGILAANNYDEISNTYNFAGELKESVRKHYVLGAESLYVKNKFEYDAQGRKTDTYQTTGSNSSTTANTPVLLSRNEYNEIGQLIKKRLHGTGSPLSFAKDVSYTYNERGWMKTINAPSLFSDTLTYNEPVSGVVPQYNGNISRQVWGLGKYYVYKYDPLNRLTSAIGGTGNNEELSYDLMGNITDLRRKQNSLLIDQLKYTYAGNRLTSVLDTNSNSSAEFQLPGTTAYSYDIDGRMTARTNAGSTGNNLTGIVYNNLNLPKTLTYDAKTIDYVYDAMGNKLRKTFGTAVKNDYIGGIHYENDVFAFAQTGEGRVVKTGSGTDPVYSYEYTISDHLGNGRVYFDIFGGVARKIQETDYYAFGLTININPIPAMQNKYQYNGKEKQDQEKLFDYGARFYDPVIGRWDKPDAMAEKYYSFSLYNYVLNNPLIYTDPTGDTVRVYTETSGGGHAWISVGEGKDMTIYTFGRYAGTNPEWHGINTFSNGTGVMLKLEGTDAEKYNQEKFKSTGATIFNVLDVSDEAVGKIMDKKFASSSKRPTKGDYKDDPRARVLDEYKLLSNNCTTTVSDVLNQSGSKALEKLPGSKRYGGGKEKFVVPLFLEGHLDSQGNTGNRSVSKKKEVEPKKEK